MAALVASVAFNTVVPQTLRRHTNAYNEFIKWVGSPVDALDKSARVALLIRI